MRSKIFQKNFYQTRMRTFEKYICDSIKEKIELKVEAHPSLRNLDSLSRVTEKFSRENERNSLVKFFHRLEVGITPLGPLDPP